MNLWRYHKDLTPCLWWTGVPSLIEPLPSWGQQLEAIVVKASYLVLTSDAPAMSHWTQNQFKRPVCLSVLGLDLCGACQEQGSVLESTSNVTSGCYLVYQMSPVVK